MKFLIAAIPNKNIGIIGTLRLKDEENYEYEI